jgi:hypothetical protein
VPRRIGPKASGRVILSPSRDIAGAMAEQVDFRQLDATNDLAVFENAAWVPSRAQLTATQAANVAAAGKGFRAAGDNELAGAGRALSDKKSDYSYSGTLKSGAAVLFAETPSARWHLRVGGRRAERDPAFGFGSVYVAPRGGVATLRYSTSILRWLSLLLELAVGVVVVRAAVDWRRSWRGEVT